MPAGQEMVRVSIQVTPETKAAIDKWADGAGVKRGYFMSMALSVGARHLARSLHPEQFMGPEVWRSLAEAMDVDPEKLKAKLAEVDAQLVPVE